MSPDLRRGVLGVVIFVGVAEAVGRTGAIDPKVLPLASAILDRAAGLATDPGFLADVGSTLLGWALGLLLTVLVAVPLGLLLGSVPLAETAARPFIEFLRPIPSVAIIPLAILLLPESRDMQLAIIVYGASWPILINTVYGLREVDPLAKDTLRSFGFGRLSVLLRVSLPSTAPFIATGIRLSAGIALILAISAELMGGGTAGIGTFVIRAGSSIDGVEMIVAATLWAGMIGLLFNLGFGGVERRLFRWHSSVRSEAS
ncbi:ABC transporter permease [Spirillospora sp. NPDC047279]|uniref:ABC transporter permease n=1 Tax=Spirillospora sp. NPDC047279 TaxID=3155478 RepID=UPI0033ED9B23